MFNTMHELILLAFFSHLDLLAKLSRNFLKINRNVHLIPTFQSRIVYKKT